MNTSLPVIAGTVSSAIFVVSVLPMLVKAWRTKDLASYSPANLVLANFGNVIHSVYVFSLPAGPIWILHSFYLVSSALMLIWYVQQVSGRAFRQRKSIGRRAQPQVRRIEPAIAGDGRRGT